MDAEDTQMLPKHSVTEEIVFVEKYFTKAQIADLAFAISATNTWNRLNKAFRTTPGTYQVNQFKTPATA